MGYEPEPVKKAEPIEEVEIPTSRMAEVNPIHSRKPGGEQHIQPRQIMDDSQELTSDDLVIDPYRNYSLPYPTAQEEAELWRKFIKWRQIRGVLGSGSDLRDISRASSIVLRQIVKEISASRNLVVLLRQHTGLGDTVVEDTENNANIAIEVFRLAEQAKGQHDEKTERCNCETCCLEDLFGLILGEVLDHMVFGKGNPKLFEKIAKATNDDPSDIRDKLCRLAVNRGLFPRSLMKLISPRTPLNELPILIEGIHPDCFSEHVLNDYQSFILNVRLEGEKAFNGIIESHLRQVVNIANGFVAKDISLPIDDLIDDLIQEGSIGLIKATESYNPAYNNRFMAYAGLTIYQSIDRAIADQACIIRIPAHMVEIINRLLKTSRRLAQEYGREPSCEEIGKRMEISPDRVKEIIKLSKMPTSLEMPIVEDDDTYLGDLIQDRTTLSPVDAASRELLKAQLHKILSELTDKERRVIVLRFGLEDRRERTLEEVGKEFNLTRERIRQIEEKAMKKLRHPSRSRKLKDYLE